jgi:hypothetical protein
MHCLYSSQAFYNPMIIRLCMKLIYGADYREDGELGVDGIDHSKSMNNKSNKRSLNSIVSSCLYQIPVPDLSTKTYGYLFRRLTDAGMVTTTS